MRSTLRGVVVAVVAATLSSLLASLALADGAQPVPWSAERPLTWADFLGSPSPDDSPTIAAQTHILLNYRYQYVSSYDSSAKQYCARIYVAALQVDCMFDPLGSWVRSDARTARVLNHEQRHFDLANVYAVKIRTAIGNAAAYGSTSEAAQEALKAQVQSIASGLAQRWHETDDSYESETANGTNAAAQTVWDQRIDSWLANPAAAP
jgi:hypothetical protein